MAKKQATTTGQLSLPFEARDEMNLAEFPIALLTDRPTNGAETIVFEDTIHDSGANMTVARKLTVTAQTKHGLPRGIDEDVIVALIQLTKIKNGFTSRKVQFSRNELVALLGWPYNGKSYRRLEDAIDRWMATTLSYENSWWDKSGQTWATEKFHIIDNYAKKDSRARNGRKENLSSEIYWNETVFNSFASGNLKDLDYDLYLRLEYATSKRMFRFLDKRLYRKAELSFDLKDFAFAHIGLSRSCEKNVAKIKEKLRNAIEELTQVGFLEHMDEDDRYFKQNLQWKVVFRKAGLPAFPAQQEAIPPIVRELIDRNVTAASASALAERYPTKTIRVKIEVFDWLVEKKDGRVSKSPDGYLVKSIRDDFATPKGFETKAQVEAKRLAAEQAELDQRARRLDTRLQVAKEQAEKKAIDAYLASLTPEQGAELEREAYAASELDAKLWGKIIVRDHVRKLLSIVE